VLQIGEIFVRTHKSRELSRDLRSRFVPLGLIRKALSERGMVKVARDLSSILFGLPFDEPRSHRLGRIDSTAAARYLGAYALSDGRRFLVRYDPAGMLEAESPGQFIAGLLPESDDLFYAPMWEGTVTFPAGTGGSADSVVIRQYGADIRGRRVAEP
jgi:hypothetical protein